MRRICMTLCMAVAIALLLATAAPAEAQDDTGTLAFGLGYYDISNDDDDAAADFRLDYRHGQGLYFLKPWAGIEATGNGALWAGAGLYLDIPIYDRVVLTGAFGAGAYREGGGKDLGHVVEFRSQAEITYRFDNGTRLGAAISHLSNAGLDDVNPGVNIVSAIYTIPLGSLIPD